MAKKDAKLDYIHAQYAKDLYGLLMSLVEVEPKDILSALFKNNATQGQHCGFKGLFVLVWEYEVRTVGSVLIMLMESIVPPVLKVGELQSRILKWGDGVREFYEVWSDRLMVL